MPRVLIVDDEVNIRKLLSGVLADEGYETESVATAEDALARLGGDAPRIDAVLLDVAMPGMDGVAALDAIARLPAPPAVVMMSGHGTLEIAVQATKAGAFDFLEKPLRPERLLVTLRNALGTQRLVRERAELLETLGGGATLRGDSPPMQRLRDAIRRAADSQARVLITGENGTGKELVARAVHDQSRRAAGPFIRLNCAAIPRDLIESELFGHERGAFTGAVAAKPGKFELANRGTLLLDEIGDMSLETQAKLLRVLEENELERLGGVETRRLDVRVLAATNQDLPQAIGRGAFREDLYFRLAVVTLEVPPLRDRGGDIAALATHFLGRACEQNGRRPKRLEPDALEALAAHAWPGNVRELRNMMERLVIMQDAEAIGAAHLRPLFLRPTATDEPAAVGGSLRLQLENQERRLVERALRQAGGNVAEAARALGLDRANLHRKLRRFGLRGPA